MAQSTGFLMDAGAKATGRDATAKRSWPPPATPILPPFADAVYRELLRYLSSPNSLAVLEASAHGANTRRDHLAPRHLPEIVAHVQASFDFFGVPGERRAQCLENLRALAGAPSGPPGARTVTVTVTVAHENDVVRARLAGRALCRKLAFSEARTGHVVAAISEVARNIFKHAGTGTVTVRRIDGPTPGIEVVASDSGPGIPDVNALLRPESRARTSAGAGLRATRDLVDFFDIASTPGTGTTVTLRKHRSR